VDPPLPHAQTHGFTDTQFSAAVASSLSPYINFILCTVDQVRPKRYLEYLVFTKLNQATSDKSEC
jgi:hypothetical protein